MEFTILSESELTVLWVIALLLPAASHILVRTAGMRMGIDPGRALPRVTLLTVATITTLVWLTGSRFSAVTVGEDSVHIAYAIPGGRVLELTRENIAEVRLTESRFPRAAYRVEIESASGRVYRSVGVTPNGLNPLYAILEEFRPGETPYIALR